MLEPDPAPGTRPLDGQFYLLVVEDPGHFFGFGAALAPSWRHLGSILGRLGIDVGGSW